jgi:acyl-CoA synthetase (AMP-forming)/AMP-acid ligase II
MKAFDHSVALCELHLHALRAGARQLFISSSVLTTEPINFWQVLSTHQIAYTFAPNSFLAAALQCYNNNLSCVDSPVYNFQHLRVLFCGGEANKTSNLHQAAEFLVRHGGYACAVTAVYGLSETCSALFYSRHSPEYDAKRGYIFASVGKPLPRHEVRIVDDDLQPTETGRVQVRGPMIFKSYYNDAKSTNASRTHDGWFETGDQGKLDNEGNLVIVGRKKEIIILNAQNYACADLDYWIEASLPQELQPGYTATFSIHSEKSDSEEIVVIVSTRDNLSDDLPTGERVARQIEDVIIGLCKKRPVAIFSLPSRMIPKNSIGKISRAALKASFIAVN